MIKGNSASYKVCSDCGITSTPLWRGGPNGPKTMCNACGIRWKRANQSSHKASKANYEPSSSSSSNSNRKKQAKHSHDYYSEDEFDVVEDMEEEEAIISSLYDDLAIQGVNPFNHSTPDSQSHNDINVIPTSSNTTETEPKEPNSTKSESDTFKNKSSNKQSTKKKFFNLSPKSKPYSKREKSPKRDSGINSPAIESEAENSMLILQQAAEEYDRMNDELSSQERMEHLYYEVLALKQELEKRDAVINMYRAKENQIKQIESEKQQLQMQLQQLQQSSQQQVVSVPPAINDWNRNGGKTQSEMPPPSLSTQVPM